MVAALIIVRTMLVPESFGKLGHYRADSVDENASLEITYAGYRICIDCHDDVYELKQESNHRNLSCETCHGPAAAHTEAPDEILPDVPIGRELCTLCHGYNPARPSGFPQILPSLHNPGDPCMTCHEAHNPELPHAPEECSACHREIASQKAVSHHVKLPCTECHEVPEEHLVTPATHRAGKPSGKEVCGRCHATDADSPRSIPRISLDTHGERYVCWDCHYPHHPEAKRR